MFWLVVVAAVVAQDPVLPGALPPLDDALLHGSDDDGVAIFGQGRVLVGAEDRDVVADVEPVAGAALTGRVGAAGRIGDLRAAVVVGDGAWFTSPGPSPSLQLVARPFLAPLQRVSLEVPVGLFGAPGLLVLGRFPLEVADGRLVGSEPFDPRGRTVDGAVVDVELLGVSLRGGAVALDLGAGEDVTGDWSGLGFVAGHASLFPVHADLAPEPLQLVVDVYGLLHRVGREQLARPTLGARAVVDVVGLRFLGGLDGQLALDEAGGFGVVDRGAHAELSVITVLPWSLAAPRPFLEVGVEGTGALLAPAPTTHATLGALDLVDLRNTWQTRAGIGVEGDDGFFVRATWRLVQGLGKIHSPGAGGVFVVDSAAALFNEIDVDLRVPIDDGVGIDVLWAVAVGRGVLPTGPAQRLIVGLHFSFGDDDGLLADF